MIPSSNTMMEVDFARDLPPGTALHTARMFMEDTTPAGENRMLDEFALQYPKNPLIQRQRLKVAALIVKR